MVDYVREKLKAETPVEMVETVTGGARIIRVFSKNKDKQVVGGKVEEGEIKSGSMVKIIRRDAEIGEGKIKELQMQKIKADIVVEGGDFGMMIESKIDIVEGDKLHATSLVKQ